MGNTVSSSVSTPGCLRNSNGADANHDDELPTLAMMAVARKVFLKKVHILMLRYSMAKLSDEYGMIEREGFDQAVARLNLSNIEIFDLLFTMWDNTADGKVPYKKFCMGISPLACPTDDLAVAIQFALRVSDDKDRKFIEWKELHELLMGINSTASYFGDAHLLPIEIKGIIEVLFERQDVITHEECVKMLSMNPYVKRFASGKVRSNVRFRCALETKFIFDKEKLVTDYIIDDIDNLVSTQAGDSEKEIIPDVGESASSSSTLSAPPAPPGYDGIDDMHDNGALGLFNGANEALDVFNEAQQDLVDVYNEAIGMFSSQQNLVDVPFQTNYKQLEFDENSGLKGNSIVVIVPLDPPKPEKSSSRIPSPKASRTTSPKRRAPPKPEVAWA